MKCYGIQWPSNKNRMTRKYDEEIQTIDLGAEQAKQCLADTSYA